MSIVKYIAIFGIICLNISLYIIGITSSTYKYEISLYNSYHPIFWILLLCSLASSITIMSLSIYVEKWHKSWKGGWSLLIYTNLVILLLPFFRGYYSYDREDTLTHIGMVKDIIITGHFSQMNIYPIIHIYVAVIHYITQLNIIMISNIIPIFFYLLFLIFIHALSLVITTDRRESMLITLFGSILLYGLPTIAPSLQAFYYVPLLMYIYYKKKHINFKHNYFSLILVLFLLFIPFIHPLTTIVVAIILLILSTIELLISKLNYSKKESNLIQNNLSYNFLFTPLISIVLLFLWISNFRVFNLTVKRVYDSVFNEYGNTQLDRYSGLLERVNISIYDFIDLVIKIHGAHIVYILVSFFALYVAIKYLKRRKIILNINLYLFTLYFFIFLVITVFCFIYDFIVGYGRALKYVILFSSILNGIIYHKLFLDEEFGRKKNLKWYRNKFCILLIIILFISSTISLYNLFPSPYINSYNSQVMYSEMEGIAWFLKARNTNFATDDIKIVPFRFADALLGTQTKKQNLMTTGIWTYPPDHFNYSNRNILNPQDGTDRYLLLSNLSKELYPKVYPQYPDFWRFNEMDFIYLNLKPNVNKLYTNDGIEIYYVNTTSFIKNTA